MYINLAMLPEDGDPNGLRSVTLHSKIQLHTVKMKIPIAFTFLALQHHTANDRAGDSGTVCATATIYPAASGSIMASQWFYSINKFNTEGQISCAFPTLFPTGAADFLAAIPLAVTTGNYLKLMMLYEDGRFAKHPRFHHSTQRCVGVLYKQDVFAFVSIDMMLSCQSKNSEEWLIMKGEAFSNCVLHYATSIRGTGSSSEVDSLPW